MTSIMALVVGAGLGLFYFGGLWLTIQQLPIAQHPYRLIAFSFLSRLIIVFFAVSLILSGNSVFGVIPLLLCCIGFLGVRTILILLIQPRSRGARWQSQSRINS